MTNTEKALELVQKCLDDWPYAATRVVDIMTRLEKVKELLKEQEEQERKWLQNIADNQLAIGGVDPLTEYEQGKWDGLQMAYEILTEEK